MTRPTAPQPPLPGLKAPFGPLPLSDAVGVVRSSQK
jgi:hypothetical protein